MSVYIQNSILFLAVYNTQRGLLKRRLISNKSMLFLQETPAYTPAMSEHPAIFFLKKCNCVHLPRAIIAEYSAGAKV